MVRARGPSVWEQSTHLGTWSTRHWCLMLANLSPGLSLPLISPNLSFSPVDGKDCHLNTTNLTCTFRKGKERHPFLSVLFSRGPRTPASADCHQASLLAGQLARCHLPAGLLVGACEWNRNVFAFSSQLPLIAVLRNKVTFFLRMIVIYIMMKSNFITSK